jgi:tape measure domain-containing protein
VSVVANVAINVDASKATQQLRAVQQGAQSTNQAIDKLNATTAAAESKFKVAANGVRYFTDATGRARAENGRFLSSTERAAAGITAQGRAAEQASAKFDGIGDAVGKLGIAFAGIQAAQFIFAKTAELESQTRSLETLTGSAEKAGQIIKQLQDLGAVTPFTSTELIDAAKRLQAFGVEANKVVETTKRLADVSGATGAELQGLVTAYGQVQAKGRLQGEELLQFQERGVGLQKELQKMYGLSGEELQKALSKGQISAEAVEVAIIRLTNAGGKYANGAIAQSDTLSGKFSTLIDNVETLARQIGTALSPTIKRMLDQLTGSAQGIITILNNIKIGFDNIAKIKIPTTPIDNWINSAKTKLAEFQTFIDSNPALRILYGAVTRGGFGMLSAIGQPNVPAGNKTPAAAAVNPATPALLTPIDKSAAKKEADIKKQVALTKDLGDIENYYHNQKMGQQAGLDTVNLKIQALSKNATAEEVRKLNITKAQYEYSLKMIAINQAETEALRRNMDIEDARLRSIQERNIRQNAQRELDIAGQEINNQLKTDELNQRLKIEQLDQKALENLYKKLGLTTELLNLTPAIGAQAFGGMEVPTFQTNIDLLGQQEKALQAILEKYPQIGEAANAASNMATQGVAAMIEGTKTAEQVFADFLKNIADMLLKTAQQMIAQYLAIAAARALAGLFGGGSLGGAGGAANGSAFGATAFGGGVGGSADFFKMPSIFGRAVGGPVAGGTPYMVGEKGPELFVPGASGTIVPASTTANLRESMGAPSANGSGSPVLNMTFETTKIAGTEYVSREQLEAAMLQTRRQASADGAKRGMSMTLDKLQQSPQTRSRVGIG